MPLFKHNTFCNVHMSTKMRLWRSSGNFYILGKILSIQMIYRTSLKLSNMYFICADNFANPVISARCTSSHKIDSIASVWGTLAFHHGFCTLFTLSASLFLFLISLFINFAFYSFSFQEVGSYFVCSFFPPHDEGKLRQAEKPRTSNQLKLVFR